MASARGPGRLIPLTIVRPQQTRNFSAPSVSIAGGRIVRSGSDLQQEDGMTSGQAGFLIGFALAVLVWAGGFWVTVGAALAGLIGWAVVRVLDGDVDLDELQNALSRGDRRSSRRP